MGSNWQVVPGLPTFSTFTYLASIEVISANNVWVVGQAQNGGYHPITLHYDGSTWLTVDPTTGGEIGQLNAVAAVSANDIWAVGIDSSVSRNRALTCHSTGRSWPLVPNPGSATRANTQLQANALYDLAVVQANDVSAVGSAVTGEFTSTVALTEHWNGSAWSIVPATVANARAIYVTGVTSVAATNNVWAEGY